MLCIILIPLTLHCLPIYCFTISNSLSLLECLLMLYFLGMTQTHRLNSSLIEHTDGATTHSIMKVTRAKGLPLHIKV